MDAAIISLLATFIALMFGGFWLLWRAIRKDNTYTRKVIAEQYTYTRKVIAEQYTYTRKVIAELRQGHARLENTLETLPKLTPTATNASSETDTTP